ncbi:MAG: Holliday junction resolvase RuvX [Neisseria sp.]|nr:Holliday junction resolvase RuvX [Neisseria sp.]
MPESSGSLLAFDFGLERIGVAQGSSMMAIAHPLMTVCGQNNTEKFQIIAKLLDEWRPTALVVGLPVHLDGTPHEMTAAARKFARRLAGRFRLPVHLVDERLTSLAAEQRLKEAQVFGKKQKPVLDQVAAMAILDTFFTAGAQETVPPRHGTSEE